MDKVAAPI